VWSVELFEFSLVYKSRGPIKSQCLADFVAELQKESHVEEVWILYVDGSSNKKESGAGIVLEGLKDIKVEHQGTFLVTRTSGMTHCLSWLMTKGPTTILSSVLCYIDRASRTKLSK